ncbi:MerR family transcriptional regulator [Tenacibaculum discolor]|uniref:Chaperone modulator CbpM n=1 Tax=Tenacibaculum discolor TaxID=361581 RepID=A0A2G1BRF7_9FLAO|nr:MULTISPECIES: chaperone modulator CbpM [Tenacibaculum]MDP2542103.1 chaperone modulator CbpM [Tenacibaculum discolor]NVK08172.1 MerR family transcriptional regulator [Tenacibaculum sp.]PHN96607.1 MerR family transcriptional regulator [Tenacibaculum discolor]PHN99811.1 MerR family transcriptional regulator [Rhodobacteraceae bacterium 4F10]
MGNTELISVQKVIVHHNLDEQFIESIESFQLIEFVVKDSNKYLHTEQLPILEKIIRLHYDLEVNMQGIDVINNMLDRMDSMHKTIKQLENKLKLYE